MKKYVQSATKISGVLLIVCVLMIAAGVLLTVLSPEQRDLICFLFAFAIPWAIILLVIYIPSARSYLLMDDEKIVFPLTRVPKLSLKRNTVMFSEIKRVKVVFEEGDGIIVKDCNFYRFHLKNGLEFTETLFSYGKESEKEIVSVLKEKTRVTY